ncbi:MAG: DUF4339 domain-containing protein [Bacteroidales bacterium]|nr:DUF4339 domain-containing protein [Bacteroidales bacterium]
MEVHQRLSSHYFNDLAMAEDSGSFIEKMMELGIGMSMIQQMPAMMNSVMPQANTQGVTPPPVQKQSQTYLAVDGTQAGPFSDEELVKLAQNTILTPETLVWKTGMSAWAPASQVPEVNKLFILAKMK